MLFSNITVYFFILFLFPVYPALLSQPAGIYGGLSMRQTQAELFRSTHATLIQVLAHGCSRCPTFVRTNK